MQHCNKWWGGDGTNTNCIATNNTATGGMVLVIGVLIRINCLATNSTPIRSSGGGERAQTSIV